MKPASVSPAAAAAGGGGAAAVAAAAAAAGGGSAGGGGGGAAMLNGAKLRAKIGSIVEQPPYMAGEGGLACTDRDSYATCRGLLILAALQMYPLLALRKGDFPADFAVLSLVEAHPADVITGTSRDAAFIRAGGDGNPNHISMHIACRAGVSALPLLPEEVLRRVFHCLALWKHPAHGDEMTAYEAELAAFFRERLYNPAAGVVRVPTSLRHLVHMHVLPAAWEAEYREWVGLDATLVPGAAGPSATTPAPSPTSPPGKTATRGSAVSLWWPVRPDAITFDEMQARLAAARVVAAAKHEDSEEDKRAKMRAAALARMQAAKPSPTA